jgi:hypothetical protein
VTTLNPAWNIIQTRTDKKRGTKDVFSDDGIAEGKEDKSDAIMLRSSQSRYGLQLQELGAGILRWILVLVSVVTPLEFHLDLESANEQCFQVTIRLY